MRGRSLTILGLAALGAAPAPAQAPGDALRVDPNTAGKGSHLILDVRPAEDPMAQGRSPQAAVLRAARGFRFDPRARTTRCSPAQAKAFECPAASRIGTGSANATVTNGVVSQDVTADVLVFLGPPPEGGDVAGVVLQFRERSSGQRGTVTGRVIRTGGTFGLEVRFDLSRAGAPPEGFQVRINRLQADVGAFRHQRVRKHRYVRRNGRLRRVAYYKRVRRDLIRNPLTCDGAWAYRFVLRYSNDDESVRDGSVACSR